MCKEAREIQKLKKGKNQFSNQDFVAYNFGSGLKTYVCSEISRYWTFQDLIWLPTQEQQQEMIQKESYRLRIEKFEDDILIECFFKNKVEDSYYITGRLKLEGNNYQELLLRIVMYRKYSKTWTGEKWVKTE